MNNICKIESTTITLDEVEEVEDYSYSNAIEDLVYELKGVGMYKLKGESILSINNIFLDEIYRNKGIGSKELKELCEEDPSIIIIAITTGDDDRLSMLDSFLRKVGFVDVNSYIGKYEDKGTYIYNNDIGGKFIDLTDI